MSVAHREERWHAHWAGHRALLLVLAIFIGAAVGPAAAKTVTISNTQLRLDQHLQPFDAHDGTIIRFTPGGRYHYYAMGYGQCDEGVLPFPCVGHRYGSCGFAANHTISLWTSPTLESGTWRFEGQVLAVEGRPEGIYYRPKVVYNKKTMRYVLWANWLKEGKFAKSQYLVATSESPAGPFTVVSGDVQTLHPTGGDFDIFIDDDDHAYLIYTSIAEKHRVSVERLGADYLTSAAVGTAAATETSGFLPGQQGMTNCNESPAMFVRGGVYYVIFGHCCCMCSWGAGVKVHTAPHPLGPWTAHGDVASKFFNLLPITKAQQAFVIDVSASDEPRGSRLVWAGDQWQSSPDRVKAHDLQYWWPMEFDDSVSPPALRQFQWSDEVVIDVAVAQDNVLI